MTSRLHIIKRGTFPKHQALSTTFQLLSQHEKQGFQYDDLVKVVSKVFPELMHVDHAEVEKESNISIVTLCCLRLLQNSAFIHGKLFFCVAIS